ncbi:hypothetical protein SprV_0802476700 [Sparganum proliferum]
MGDAVMDDYQKTSAACVFIRGHTAIRPQVGIICGSGLGNIVDLLANQIVIPYSKIPGFPSCTVLGHEGKFVFGELGGKSVVVMQGRFHPYEGYSHRMIALPIRVMKMLGATYLFVTNAAGGMNRTYKPGDMVVIQDHVDFSSVVGLNPLTGPNDERFGPRFPALTGMYDAGLRELAQRCGRELGLGDCLHEGIYFHAAGPVYETPATNRILLSLGCDAIGMSTTQETIVARHMGMKIFAISMITNLDTVDEKSEIVPNHEEVLQMANLRAPLLAQLLEKMVKNL